MSPGAAVAVVGWGGCESGQRSKVRINGVMPLPLMGRVFLSLVSTAQPFGFRRAP